MDVEGVFLQTVEGIFDLDYIKMISAANGVEGNAIIPVNRQKDIMAEVSFEIKRVIDIIGGVHSGELLESKREGLDEQAQKTDLRFLSFSPPDDLLELSDIKSFLVVEMRDTITVIHQFMQLLLFAAHCHLGNCVTFH